MTAPNHTLDFVTRSSKQFIYCDDMKRAISLSLVSGKNLILHGPGGHAKSAMLDAVLGSIDADVFVQSFGEGMDEARIYGGLDLPALNDGENARIQYRPGHSFLASDVAVFEEVFDAPSTVLLSLKDTMTAGGLRNGEQQYRSKCSVIMAATNKTPGEIANLDAASAALVERFPLQVEVAWEEYSADSYRALYEAERTKNLRRRKKTLIKMSEIRQMQAHTREVSVPEAIDGLLAELMRVATDGGDTISPRTAIHARDLVKAGAFLEGRDAAAEEDLWATQYVPGVGRYLPDFQYEIERVSVLENGRKVLNAVVAKFTDLINEIEQANDLASLVKARKELGSLEEELLNLTLPDELSDQRSDMKVNIRSKMKRALVRMDELA